MSLPAPSTKSPLITPWRVSIVLLVPGPAVETIDPLIVPALVSDSASLARMAVVLRS